MPAKPNLATDFWDHLYRGIGRPVRPYTLDTFRKDCAVFADSDPLVTATLMVCEWWKYAPVTEAYRFADDDEVAHIIVHERETVRALLALLANSPCPSRFKAQSALDNY